jgi:ribosomal protein S12 methylthiotransferase accessory factor
VHDSDVQLSHAVSPVSPFIGIVTYLIDVETSRGAPEIFVAASKGPDMTVLGHPTGANIAGSGAALDREEARAAAIGECLERYSASIVPQEDLVIASYEALTLGGYSAHEPSDWALFDPIQQVGYPSFSPDLRIAWTEGWNLSTNRSTFLPACFSYLSSSPVLRTSGASVIGPSVSTGCACATNRTESLFKGLCELVERDAFMIAWRNRLPLPEIAIDEDSALYDVYRARFARPGLEYRIWQTSLDLSVPSFFGVLLDRRRPRTRAIVGGAAHPDAERAVQKTLCELTQGLAWLEHLADDTAPPISSYDHIRSFTDRARLYAFQYDPNAFSFLFGRRETMALSSVASRRDPLEVLLNGLVKDLVDHGLQPCAVDLTPDDVRACGYVVTRVVVPGLETMEGDYRFQFLGGTRWRNVPVRIGMLRSSTDVVGINPFPHPYP